jgi:broad specificity phosphatase PhoE
MFAFERRRSPMIYLIRHGEPAATWSEHPNPGLSELGHRQAAAAAEAVATLGAKRAIVSPLQRCRETAAPYEKVMETHARIEPAVGEIIHPPGVEDRGAWLRGVMQGNWTGVGADFDRWRASALAAVDRLQDETAVYSHFVAINAIVGLLTGDDRVVIFKPGHCSITKLVRRGGTLAVAELGAEAATVVT